MKGLSKRRSVRTAVCLAACLAAETPAAAAPPIPQIWENWDAYGTGTDDPAYNDVWETLPDAERYPIVQVGEKSIPGYNSGPNCLRIDTGIDYGITRNLLPEIEAADPEATLVNGTDSSPLEVQLLIDLNKDAVGNEDFIVELSRGDPQLDETEGELKDVIAFGFTYTWFGVNANPRIFDGEEWTTADTVPIVKRWHDFTLRITTDAITLIGARQSSGEFTIDRAYFGGFDRISIRTNRQQDQVETFDDFIVRGGEVYDGGGDSAPVFIRGDTSGDGSFILNDGIQILERLFANRPAFDSDCEETGDANNSGQLEIGDAVWVLNYLFADGPIPDPPAPACGADPDPPGLGCNGTPPGCR
ncbi:MAG: hypothetical protein JXP34_09320 [Planctomycetes bacterium]|nr:hypothetical protein [Planctomycetota bacterium]